MKPIVSNKKGFTLLEIIVVMIIVGVLAAIALPNLFANVERQRAQEALNTIGLVNNGIMTCVQANLGSPTNCSTLNSVGVTLPPKARFSYTIADLSGNLSADGATDTLAWTIRACRTTFDNGTVCTSINNNGGSSLWLARASGNVVTKGGNGAFAGVW